MMGNNHHSSEHRPRTLTIMEPREGNFPIIEDYIKSAKTRGWRICELSTINSDLIARFDFDSLPLEYVIYRGLDNDYAEVKRVMRWLKAHHKVTMNMFASGGPITCCDKHQQQGAFMLDPLLKKYLLPTFEAKYHQNVMSYIDGNRVHFPIVLKPRSGSTGKGIMLVNNQSELSNLHQLGDMLIEQYIRPECDFRVFTVGGVAVGIMRKTGDMNKMDDFEAWSGGYDRAIETDPDLVDILSEIGTRASAATRTEYGGSDILKSAKTGKFYLLENNIAAGWMNFLPITHIDIPGIIIDWFTDIANSRHQPYHLAIKSYLKHWRKYLPLRIQRTLKDIAAGKPGVLDPYRHIFATYPQNYLYDAGYIFNHLASFYDEFTQNSGQIPNPEKLKNFLAQIESTPFSWAGNFIGPEVGTFHDGAILSALYLYLRDQLKAEKAQN